MVALDSEVIEDAGRQLEHLVHIHVARGEFVHHGISHKEVGDGASEEDSRVSEGARIQDDMVERFVPIESL